MDTVTWTDDKIDALDGKVDALTTRVDVLDGKVDTLITQVGVLDTKVDERFRAVNQQLKDLKAGQTQMNDRFDAKFDALNRTLLQLGGGLIGTLIAGIVTLLAVVLTH